MRVLENLAWVFLLVCLSIGVAFAQEPGDMPDPFDDDPTPGLATSEEEPATLAELLAEGSESLEEGRGLSEQAAKAEGKSRKKLERRARRSYEKSERSFMEALGRNEDLLEAFVGLAHVWSATGDTEKAFQAWSEAYRREPTDEAVLIGLGESMMDLGRPRDAASIYSQLLQHAAAAAPGYLAQLRSWAEGQAAGGDPEAELLLEWIEQRP